MHIKNHIISHHILYITTISY